MWMISLLKLAFWQFLKAFLANKLSQGCTRFWFQIFEVETAKKNLRSRSSCIQRLIFCRYIWYSQKSDGVLFPNLSFFSGLQRFPYLFFHVSSVCSFHFSLLIFSCAAICCLFVWVSISLLIKRPCSFYAFAVSLDTQQVCLIFIRFVCPRRIFAVMFFRFSMHFRSDLGNNFFSTTWFLGLI